MLNDKVAVIYGGGGAIGGTAARAFGSEGARVFLTGRTLAPVEVGAKEIVSAGGLAEAVAVDAGTPFVGGWGSSNGRCRGTHPGSVSRARTSGHSRGRSATTGDSRDAQDQGSLRALRRSIGNELGTVPGVAREQDSHPPTVDARRHGERGGLRGIRQGERTDWNGRQLEHGKPGRLALGSLWRALVCGVLAQSHPGDGGGPHTGRDRSAT
jgi:hypothetical protein